MLAEAATQTYWVRPFAIADAEAIQAQMKQTDEFEALKSYGADGWSRLEAGGKIFTGFHGDRIIGIAGFIEFWPSRWLAWSVLSNTVNRADMVYIHKFCKAQIDSVPHRVRRLEMTVNANFNAGHRWAKMLGFTEESLMRSYDPCGRDHVMYVKIRD